jgi:hypothetical protein
MRASPVNRKEHHGQPMGQLTILFAASGDMGRKGTGLLTGAVSTARLSTMRPEAHLPGTRGSAVLTSSQNWSPSATLKVRSLGWCQPSLQSAVRPSQKRLARSLLCPYREMIRNISSG